MRVSNIYRKVHKPTKQLKPLLEQVLISEGLVTPYTSMKLSKLCKLANSKPIAAKLLTHSASAH